MYEPFFRMSQRPFAAVPSTSTYFAAGAIDEARQTIARAIERAAGPAVVLGPAGTGKSLLLAMLALDFAGRFDVALLSGGGLRSVRSLLQNILFELKLPFRDLSEGELRLALLDRLEPKDRSPNGLLLLVDEAHVLPSKLLDELRMITNLVRGGQPRVRLVLAGDVRLEERLANPRLASLTQRVAARCYLQPLNRDETFGYVRAQLAQAGVMANDIVDDEALATLHRSTGGVPRLLNQLCDHALILATIAGERKLTADRVEEAWADLQRLPPPARATSGDEHEEPASIIEFGALDELPRASGRAAERTTRFDGPSRNAREVIETFVERDPLEQLDVIERGLAAAQDDDAFDPLALAETEIELTFTDGRHPFGGVFHEEEVVIDRYASLEAKSLKNRPRVSSSEGRAIATLMGTVSPVTPRRQLGVVSAETNIVAPAAVAEAFDDPFDPASDPVLPEVSPSVNGPSPELVVVDTIGDARPAPPAEPTGRAHRQEYRQLFARLRRGG